MKIVPIPAFKDNYIWLLTDGHRAICIDPGEADPVAGYLQQHGIALQTIWLTHGHADHTGGVQALRKHYPQCAVYGNPAWGEGIVAVTEGAELKAGSSEALVWGVPGHTADHLAYRVSFGGHGHLFCGDTLFSAGCGRVFSANGGTMEDMYRSLQRIDALPADTLLYPAHEYTAGNLLFAAAVEPDNEAVREALAGARHTPTLPVTLAHERNINPFLRIREPAVRAAALRQCSVDMENDTDFTIFRILREWKNRF